MKYYTIITLCFCLFISCRQSEKIVSNPNLQRVSIYFANAHIDIPRSYRLTTPDQMGIYMHKSGMPEKVIAQNIHILEALKGSSIAFLIYADTADFQKNIWFMDIKNVHLTKMMSQQYLGMAEQRLKETWTPLGVEYKRVESRFETGADARLLKLKYKLTKGKFIRYTTQYIISTNKQSLGIMINNSTPEDFESLVTKMTI